MPPSPSRTLPLPGPELGPAAGGRAAALVILLHGVGANGDDLIGLAPHLASALPDARFIAPDAPEAFPYQPMGGRARQWFPVDDMDLHRLAREAERARPVLEAYIEAALARDGLAPRHLALVGFSQGAMMALAAALARVDPVAAVVSFSGAHLGAVRPDVAHPPVLLVHGAADTVVPAHALDMTRESLWAAGVDVTAHLRPGLGHGIDPEALALARDFLVARLAPGKSIG
ncbi:MAG: alpha/beta fold hydrolase [Alphaproteobacteria bacterium]